MELKAAVPWEKEGCWKFAEEKLPELPLLLPEEGFAAWARGKSLRNWCCFSGELLICWLLWASQRREGWGWVRLQAKLAQEPINGCLSMGRGGAYPTRYREVLSLSSLFFFHVLPLMTTFWSNLKSWHSQHPELLLSPSAAWIKQFWLVVLSLLAVTLTPPIFLDQEGE